MGSTCIQMGTKKVIVLKKPTETIQSQGDLKLFFDENKIRIHKKLHPIYDEIIKTGHFTPQVVNLNFINFLKSDSSFPRQVFPYFQSIKVLKLWKTSLGSEGIKEISPELMDLKNLEVLSLEDNSIGPDGSMYLSLALKKLQNLKELWLHINEIGPSGANCLTKVLGSLNKLEKLNLDENSMENKETLKLVTVIKGLKRLKMLGLAYNNLTDDAALNIAALLTTLPLEKLVMSGNKLSEESHSRIISLLAGTLIIF